MNAPGPDSLGQVRAEDARPRQPLRLLIVDEHPVSLKVLPLIFRRRGYVCAVAATAAEAVEAVSRHRPDAVILEWLFRGGQGVGLPALLRARAASHDRELVVIALSVVEACDLARLPDVDDYFVKPAPAALIDRRIRDLLRVH